MRYTIKTDFVSYTGVAWRCLGYVILVILVLGGSAFVITILKLLTWKKRLMQFAWGLKKKESPLRKWIYDMSRRLWMG